MIALNSLHFSCFTEDNQDQYVKDIRDNFSKAFKLVKDNIKISQENQKKFYDRKAKKRSFNIGDKVLIKNPKIKGGIKGKIKRKWQGPAEIVEKKSDAVYKIRDEQEKRSKIFVPPPIFRDSDDNDDDDSDADSEEFPWHKNLQDDSDKSVDLFELNNNEIISNDEDQLIDPSDPVIRIRNSMYRRALMILLVKLLV